MPLPFHDHGSGPPIILLHAFPLSASMWAKNAEAIVEAGFRVICPELPGFGRNSEFGRVSSMDEMADGVIDLVNSLEIRNAAFAGLSMGGYALFSILRARPDLVSCFALCDTTARADTEEKRKGRSELIARLEHEGAKVLVDVMLPNLLSPITFADRPDLADELRERFLECDPRAAAAALRGMAERRNSIDTLAEAKLPSILILGEDDKVTGLDAAREMHDAAENSKLAVIPRAGHYSNLEAPAEFNENLISFLKDNLVTH